MKNSTSNARELRIGNLVDLFGQVATIQRDDFDGSGIAVDNGKPIPLTEEWLVRFGFEKRNYEMKFGGFQLEAATRIVKTGELSAFYYEKYLIKYVHQLQNLYFALTGEELSIT